MRCTCVEISKSALGVVVSLVLLLLGPVAASAQNDVGELGRGAERVVVGQITDVSAHFDTNEFGDQLIISTVKIRVDETLKGPSDRDVEFELEGGTVGDLTLDVSDLPRLVRGERFTVFLSRSRSGALVPHGRASGLMKLDSRGRVVGTGYGLDELRKAVRP